jgi:chemotaxis protein MotB
MRPPRRENKSHGGSWKVAYADFVTAMMAFFLLMWILGIVPKDVQHSIETYFKYGGKHTATGTTLGAGENASAPLMGSPEVKGNRLTEEQAARFVIAMRLRKFITTDPLLNEKESSGVSADDLGVLLRVNNAVLFKPGSAELTPESEKVVTEVQGVLKSFNLYLVIRGHAQHGEAKGGPFPSAWELSGARAAAMARAILADKDINPQRIRAVAYADTRPLVPPLSPEEDALNRRVEFYFHRPEVMSYQVVM